MAKRQKQQLPERPFMKLSVEEMAAQVQLRDEQLGRRNCLVLVLFFAFFFISISVLSWFYGQWFLTTLSAAWQVLHSIWNLQWWQAAAIVFEYKLSFFLLGIFAGFLLFLFVAFQIGEMLIDFIWDWLGSLFGG
ncbi:MAG: hypothetical protein KDE19_17870 [Caldilineaceae bacterium]|nr:hypothetical protein [Caldilineaceae bacterium]